VAFIPINPFLASFRFIRFRGPWQDEAFHGIGKTFILTGRRHVIGLPSALQRSRSHRYAEATGLEHQARRWAGRLSRR